MELFASIFNELYGTSNLTQTDISKLSKNEYKITHGNLEIKLKRRTLEELREYFLIKVCEESKGYPFEEVELLMRSLPLYRVVELYYQIKRCENEEDKYKILRDERKYIEIKGIVKSVMLDIYRETGKIMSEEEISKIVENSSDRLRFIANNNSLDEIEEARRRIKTVKDKLKYIPKICVDAKGKIQINLGERLSEENLKNLIETV